MTAPAKKAQENSDVSDDAAITGLLTPLKAVRAKCLDCCCGHSAEVRRCVMPDCPLHPYRMGHRPKKGAPA